MVDSKGVSSERIEIKKILISIIVKKKIEFFIGLDFIRDIGGGLQECNVNGHNGTLTFLTYVYV